MGVDSASRGGEPKCHHFGYTVTLTLHAITSDTAFVVAELVTTWRGLAHFFPRAFAPPGFLSSNPNLYSQNFLFLTCDMFVDLFDIFVGESLDLALHVVTFVFADDLVFL